MLGAPVGIQSFIPRHLREYPCHCPFAALGTLGRSGLAGDGALGAELKRRDTGGEATDHGFQPQSGCWLVQNRGGRDSQTPQGWTQHAALHAGRVPAGGGLELGPCGHPRLAW